MTSPLSLHSQPAVRRRVWLGTVREEETSELAFYSVEASLKLKRRFTFISCDVGYKLINCVSWYQDEDQLRASLGWVAA